MPQWLSYPTFSGPFSGQEQLLAASSTSPGAGMIRIPWSAVSGLITGTGFLPLTGGTLTGPLTLPGNATLPLQAVPLQQVQAITGGPFLQLAGGTLTGPLILAADPTAALGAATKEYVDGAVAGGSFLPLTGGTVTGPIVLPGNATLPLQAVPLQQVTSIIGGPYLPLGGGTLTGALVLAADPTLSLGAATKQYVDAAVVSGPFLPLAGGTVTGATTFSADVTFSGAGTGLAVSNNATVGGTFAATGGINGTPVGAVTPSTGAFTNLTASGTVTLPSTTTGPFLLLTGGTVSGPTTFSSSGTALTVTNNATVGTLTAGASTFNGTSSTIGTNIFSAGSATGTNNIIRLTPAVSGSKPSISVPGPDANTYLVFSLNGAGYVQLPRLNIQSGTTTVSGSATAEQTPFNFAAAYAGSFTGNRNLNLWNITSDNAVSPGSGNSANGYTLLHNYGGAAMVGGRIALNVALTQTAATQNSGVFYQATNFVATATQPEASGSTPTLNTHSLVFAIGSYAVLTPTATGYSGLAGYEQDVVAGAQPYGILGISAVRLTGGYGTNYQAVEPSLDTAFRVGSAVANAATWVNGYTVTSPSSPFALDTVKGTAFMVFPGQDYLTVKPALAVGIDLSYIACSTAAWHSQGAIIDGSGNASFTKASVGNWSASLSSAGLTLDTGGNQIALSASVSAGGAGYDVNEQFSFATGGRGIVTTTGSLGAVTAFTILEFPLASSPPSNPVATTSLMFSGAGQSTGSGLTLTLTWSAASLLTISPSGGGLKLGSGCFTANASTAVTLTALAPAGAHSTVQEWLTITDSAGTVRYIPCF